MKRRSRIPEEIPVNIAVIREANGMGIIVFARGKYVRCLFALHREKKRQGRRPLLAVIINVLFSSDTDWYNRLHAAMYRTSLSAHLSLGIFPYVCLWDVCARNRVSIIVSSWVFITFLSPLYICQGASSVFSWIKAIGWQYLCEYRTVM